MAKSILILGGGTMQLPAIRSARSKGYRTIVADADPTSPGAALADVFEHVDLKDEAGMLEAARRHRDGDGLDGVFTAGTDFSATVAYVAENLGLPGIPYDVARNASDKSRMRECFRRASVPHPRFAVVDETGENVSGEALDSLELPVVVKPVDNMGARGVVKVARRDRVRRLIAEAAPFSRSGRVIVEEHIPGPEFSIDAVVVDGNVIPTGVADRHIRFEPYFVEVGHTIPTERSRREIDDLVRVFAAGVDALGIVNGVAKGDVFLTPNGPVIGEIAARLSGGYMSGWTFPYSSGVDLTGAALDQALGIRPTSLSPVRDHTSAERAVISCDGVVAEVIGTEETRATIARGGPVRELFLRAESGSTVRFPRNNVEKCGNVIAVAESRARAIEAAESAVAAIVVRLRPNTPLTHRFLFGSPPAYPCYPGLEERVRKTFPFALDPERVLADRLPGGLDRVAGETARTAAGRDWNYRTADDSIARLVDLGVVDEGGRVSPLDGWYWVAFARAGVQGALYVRDCLAESPAAFLKGVRECIE